MEKKISPFSTTPGIAGKAYINIGIADEIIANFDSSYSVQYVYKILGLRGSGKSVEYKRVMDYFSEKEDWKVYGLAAGGEPTTTLISAIGREIGIQSYDEIIDSRKDPNRYQTYHTYKKLYPNELGVKVNWVELTDKKSGRTRKYVNYR